MGIAGLGYSETARYYAIKDLDEAKAYMEDYTLSNLRIECMRRYSVSSKEDDRK